MWLLWGFAAAGVVFLVLVLQSFTYATSWNGSRASAEVPKATFGGTFPPWVPLQGGVFCVTTPLQLWDLPGPAATKCALGKSL